MFHETTFFYYGIVKPITELYRNLKSQPDLEQDIYCYINDFGINYRRVGNVRTVFRIVFGKELGFIQGNPYNIIKEPWWIDMPRQELKQYKLSKFDEDEIIYRIRQAGSVLRPSYFITYNFYYD